MDIRRFILDLQPEKHCDWAWKQYQPTLEKLAEAFGGKANVLEVGGGRNPTFDAEKSARLFNSYTVNDISQAELDRAPDYVKKSCFDIASEKALPNERYDLIFSKMVFEHIKDGERAWRNTHALLSEGGVALHFMPTLYCPPFVVNRLLPEALSYRILTHFFPTRNAEEHPKFPAYYHLCRSTSGNQERIRALGFSEVAAVPFYHHHYFYKIPLLKQMDSLLSKTAKENDWRMFSSFAYMVAQR